MRKLLALFALLPLAACSGGDGSKSGLDAGPADAGDPVAVFGLAQGSCYELSATDQTASPPSLGVAVESDSTTSIRFLADGGSQSIKARTLVYRKVGSVQLTDYLYVDGPDVLLVKRIAQSGEELDFHPAVTLMRVPLKASDHLDQTGQADEFLTDGGRQLADYPVTFDVSEGSVTTPAAPSGQDAFTYAYAGAPNRVPSLSFVPGSGLVQLSAQLGSDTGAPVYKLQNTKQLATGAQNCGAQ